jgi:hypothetical protein
MRRHLIAVVGLAGCGGEPAPEAPDADSPVEEEPDAGTFDPALCRAPAAMTALPDLTEGTATIDSASLEDATLHRIDYNGRVDDTTLLRYALIEGSGAFKNGLATGSYPIAGEDADVETCGLCLLLITEFYRPARSQYFLATAGSVTIDTLVESATGRVAGTATGLELVRLVLMDDRWRPDPGCATAIDEVRLDVALEPGPFYEE